MNSLFPHHPSSISIPSSHEAPRMPPLQHLLRHRQPSRRVLRQGDPLLLLSCLTMNLWSQPCGGFDFGYRLRV
jgi:hypothetical protein